ncbi:hypothetical protein BKA70DRAFT_1380018 [Coprinopsis sp. MPI-PUGE-AT-0042]|nr:hypothetical protein BKA70DRAFT_1380018 [Coprinopsis sp. MPI-PUGE-AT-0042]
MGFGRRQSALPATGSAKKLTGIIGVGRGASKVKLIPALPSPVKKAALASQVKASSRSPHKGGDIEDGNTSHDYMRQWKADKRQEYLEELLCMETPPDEDTICSNCFSGDEKSFWKCKDCVRSKPLCSACCFQKHQDNPFHRVEACEGSFYKPSWLWKLGIFINLCPHNQGCVPCASQNSSPLKNKPAPSPTKPESDHWTNNDDLTYGAKPKGRYVDDRKVLIVVHTNGIHHLPFSLLRMGFYPSTFNEPRTVFTYALLDDYLLQILECFTSTHHFYSKLRRLTNSSFPIGVQDHTRELRRVGRQWRNLNEWKTHGFGHLGQSPQKGQLVWLCAACPQPGINLPDGWEDDSEQWKYTQSIVGNGNMKGVHRRQPQTKDDVFLKEGEGYMTERKCYAAHINCTTERKQKPTCHEHRAVTDKSKIQKGCDATGIGAWACMRHGCFLPGGVIDFQKGERQLNMDYGLSEGLAINCSEKIGKVIIAYDINCQYSIHLTDRLKKGQYLTLCEDLIFIHGIGLFHVHGHQDSCYARYALTFIRGAGVASGEILESLWAVINEIARTTSAMTHAHRMEVLDAVIGDSNWNKMLNLIESRLETVSAMDILEVKIEKAPTQLKVQLDLMDKEQVSNTGLGITSWISAGMKIQETQQGVCAFIHRQGKQRTEGKRLTETQSVEIAKKREALQKEINEFYTTGAALFPDVDFQELKCDLPPQGSVEIENNDTDSEEDGEATLRQFSLSRNDAENIELPLPSSFPAGIPASMETALDYEHKLRIGQMDDLLEKIWSDIGHKSFLYCSNVRLAEGKKGVTQGYDAVHAVDRTLRLNYKRIEKEDTQAITAIYKPNARGQRNSKMSWIWTLNVRGDSSRSVYLEELYRVNWLRAKSRLERWQEEYILLTAEMEWVLHFFDYKSDEAKVWANIRLRDPGHVAYAHRQADM